MARSREPAKNQIHLAIPAEPDERPFLCLGIFSGNYLRRQLAGSQYVPTAADVEAIYDKVKDRWIRNYSGLCRQNEAYTRTRFLDPTLSEMGWFFIPENSLPEGNTRKRPDYCVFQDQLTEQRVASQSATEIFRASETVLEAKKAEHSLDKVSDRETPGWFPSQQVQDYLRWATDGTGRRFFNWAVLTNGCEWRLYCNEAAPDAYFTFYLAYGTQFCSLEDFRLFMALFSPPAFVRDSTGRCLLDGFRAESLTQQLELEGKLRHRVFDVLEELAEGYYNNGHNQLAESDLPAVYQASLIFLYRLLFVLYAESRALLPVRRYGPGANRRYLDEFSLSRLIERLREANAYSDDAFDGLYRELLKLFHLIDGSRREQNERLGVTRYNGRLFSSAEYPEIDRWWVGEKTLADVLRQLVFAQPRARASARQAVISTEETVDYSTLEVRQLGDIYEGLLGGRLQPDENRRLRLVNERGANQREGIFYTPDWIVRYLVRETLQPLLDRIDANPDVQAARSAKSLERQRDNSFAHAVLRLNVVDPAMGSGHFLVRATEFLAEKVFEHPTTRRITEQIVSHGKSPRSRQQILEDGRIPVSPGLSQEQAEVAYWRRRVVEACIYGVDTNRLAVELAKLSLWLTCIAVDEPLSFLDHHLRCGNSLLYSEPEELRRLPFLSGDAAVEGTFEIGTRLAETMAALIKENVDIEGHASTEMEVVKGKERRWRAIREKLRPFLDVADVWIAALNGLRIDHLSYRNFGVATIDPRRATQDAKADAAALRSSIAARLAIETQTLQPFHWRLEFPDVFFQEDGSPLPDARRGFDVVLGNPPYVSTHTSSEERWRSAVERRFGYLEDTYLHFTDLGLDLLRAGGAIGFIVSDTFFTIASKLRMREWLQENSLTHLGQCDPFDATVDAAIFIAWKRRTSPEDRLLFIQARRETANSRPEDELPKVSAPDAVYRHSTPSELGVRHATQGCLRLHSVPPSLYRDARGRAFFEPSRPSIELFKRFNEPLKELLAEWWGRIDSSDRYAESVPAIRRHIADLRPGAVTLVGLIASGGQGLASANNARFLGYLEGTPKARGIEERRSRWTSLWLGNRQVRNEFLRLLALHGGDENDPTGNVAAWEACVEPLKEKFDARGQLGIRKTDLYRIVPKALVATERDFVFSWRQRKAELLGRWRGEQALEEFWIEAELIRGPGRRRNLRRAGDLRDDLFCNLCQELLDWLDRENERRRTQRPRRPPLSKAVLGLRSSEVYTSAEDAPRVATVYNGLVGRAQWLPFRKGDPEGHRWLDDDPLYIRWDESSVDWLFENSGRRAPNMPVVRNPHLYLTEGVSWTRGANHVRVKGRLQPKCVFDANGLRLTPVNESGISAPAFLAVLNSAVYSFFLKHFIDHTWMVQISDMRMMPFVIPSTTVGNILNDLALRAVESMQLMFRGASPPNDLVAYVRRVAAKLADGAPNYLSPPAQQMLLLTPADCLQIIELAVDWQAEKLYGVEGLGPFDEF